MLPETSPRELLAAGSDRRRIPRYSCSGLAQIKCFPLSASLLRGKVRDLGLGGCCIELIETIPLLDPGNQAEILVEVNSWFFRAVAHVRAIRGRFGISMEFTRMSAGGSSMLADLIADLDRSQSAWTRRQHQVAQSRQLLQGSLSRGSGLVPGQQHGSMVIADATAPLSSAEEAPCAGDRHDWLRNFSPAANLLDIFA
jgi:hypothetical protein